MKKIYLQLFIVVFGILLSIAGYLGVKKFFIKTHTGKEKYVIAYNDYKKYSNSKNFIVSNDNDIEENNKVEEETTTTTTTTKKITTTTKKEVVETFKETVTNPSVTDDGSIVFDGLTLTQLTEKLNKNLSSDLTNTGAYFANYTKKTGMDPYLAVAIVLHETGCKWTCSTLVKECNNIGGLKGSPSCGGGSYRKYDTLEQGINGYLDILYNNYYSQGLTTPELINPKYAASTTWSEKINNYINSIRES